MLKVTIAQEVFFDCANSQNNIFKMKDAAMSRLGRSKRLVVISIPHSMNTRQCTEGDILDMLGMARASIYCASQFISVLIGFWQ